MVLYIIYKDVKVLKQELPECAMAADKLGEIVIDMQVTADEEITTKGEKKVRKEEGTNGVEMSPA